MKIISLINYKGGVGKTVISANLAYELKKRKYSVLMLDLDPQRDLSKLYLPENCKEPGILELLTNQLDIVDVSVGVEENLYIVPGSRNLTHFEAKIDASRLKQLLKDPLFPEIDFVIIDHPPANSKTSLIGLAATEYVTIITDIEAFSMSNLDDLLSDLQQIKQGINPDLTVLGILVNRVDFRRGLTKYNLRQLYDTMPEIVFETYINNDTAFPISIQSRNLLRKLDWHGRSVSQMSKLTGEILNRMGVQ